MMGLRESPYSSRFLGGLDSVTRGVMFPSYWLVSQLLALQQTTAEKQACRRRRFQPHALQVLATGPLLLLLLLLCAPFLLLAFLVWLPLQAARRPFAYQHTPCREPPEAWEIPGEARTVSLLSGNVCLLPDGLAKFSNLSRTQWRAGHVGHMLAEAACCAVPGPNSSALLDALLPSAAPLRSVLRGDADVTVELPLTDHKVAAAEGPREISACFPPNVDFLCLQEVFDPQASSRLRQHLSPHFEHILYDVGTYGLLPCFALKLLNSGLFLASRYPLSAVEYHCYPNATGEDALSAKGLLCVQVQLGASQGRRVVGYLNCTHMQAPEADGQIRCDQLSLSLLWAQLFQDTHAQPGDMVAFDIYCGDLNFDNCSAGDEMEQGHEIFQLYTDPCRIGPRQDKPWAIGSLMNYLEIYDEAVATPENLKRTLEQPEGRKKYLAGPIQTSGTPDLSAAWCEGRRIDYILYREHPGPVELKTTVEKVFFITQLATCSDHLPVGLRLLVTSG